MTPIYRAEVIGSLLRPPSLQEARRAWEAGQLPTPEFKRVEDRAVDEAIALQEKAGVDVVTDGEMRRSGFFGPLTDVLEGLSPLPAPPTFAANTIRALLTRVFCPSRANSYVKAYNASSTAGNG